MNRTNGSRKKKEITLGGVAREIAKEFGICTECIDYSHAGMSADEVLKEARQLTDEELIENNVDYRSRFIIFPDGRRGLLKVSEYRRGKTIPPKDRWLFLVFFSRKQAFLQLRNAAPICSVAPATELGITIIPSAHDIEMDLPEVAENLAQIIHRSRRPAYDLGEPASLDTCSHKYN